MHAFAELKRRIHDFDRATFLGEGRVEGDEDGDGDGCDAPRANPALARPLTGGKKSIKMEGTEAVTSAAAPPAVTRRCKRVRTEGGRPARVPLVSGSSPA